MMPVDEFKNSEGAILVFNLIKIIQNHKVVLSEIDGAIGDGDHGINMSKGFSACRDRLEGKDADLTLALKTLGRVLLMEIGGSMGPIYGSFFIEMSKVSGHETDINQKTFGHMLSAGLAGIQKISEAKVGDKTLLDALVPAVDAFLAADAQGKNFSEALSDMKTASARGKDATVDMISRIGRSSRLGERSRGTLDAGATSCDLILSSMADTITALL